MSVSFVRPTWSRRESLQMNHMRQNYAGIVPYTVDNDGKLHFCFGGFRSGETMSLGTYRHTSDRSVEDTALRGCREETLGLFGLSKDNLKKSAKSTLYLYDDSMMLIFVQVNSPSQDSNETYRTSITQTFKKYNTNPHRVGLVWLPEHSLKTIIALLQPTMTLRDRRLLRDIAKLVPLLQSSLQRFATRCPNLSPSSILRLPHSVKCP